MKAWHNAYTATKFSLDNKGCVNTLWRTVAYCMGHPMWILKYRSQRMCPVLWNQRPCLRIRAGGLKRFQWHADQRLCRLFVCNHGGC